MPVIVGAPRSGTTLLRFMLDSHPQLAIPPETGFLIPAATLVDDRVDPRELYRLITNYPPDFPGWDDFGVAREQLWREMERLEPFTVAGAVRAFYRLYAQKQNKPRYGDKTPVYCGHIAAIGRLLPEARFIHILRDGRDVALSLRKTWFAPGKDMTTLARHWREIVLSGREAGMAPDRYCEVRYEELVRAPQAILETVCRFIALPFDPASLSYWTRTPERLREHKTRRRLDGSVVVTHEQRLEQQRLTMRPPQADRISAWRTEMTPAERAEFHSAAGDLLGELGYEP